MGDGDSLPAGLKAQYADIFHAVSEQEDNDLTKATRFAIGLLKASTKENGEKQPPRLAYLGATGKREDHTLGNIALMMRYLRDFAILPEMYTDYGWFQFLLHKAGEHGTALEELCLQRVVAGHTQRMHWQRGQLLGRR